MFCTSTQHGPHPELCLTEGPCITQKYIRNLFTHQKKHDGIWWHTEPLLHKMLQLLTELQAHFDAKILKTRAQNGTTCWRLSTGADKIHKDFGRVQILLLFIKVSKYFCSGQVSKYSSTTLMSISTILI